MNTGMISNVWKKMTNMSPTAKVAASLIAKDVVGCVMYTNTARTNKKYTPEKRADVANYDLANGIINIGLQLLAIKPIESLMTKFSDSRLMKHFFNNYNSRLATQDNKSLINMLKTKEGLVKGSVVILSVIICQYIIKRFISPYLSMPLGDKLQKMEIMKPKLYPGEIMNKNELLGRFNMYAYGLLPPTRKDQ